MSILLTEGAATANPLSMLIPVAVLFIFMYFFMIRPQKKEAQKKRPRGKTQ